MHNVGSGRAVAISENLSISVFAVFSTSSPATVHVGANNWPGVGRDGPVIVAAAVINMVAQDTGVSDKREHQGK